MSKVVPLSPRSNKFNQRSTRRYLESLTTMTNDAVLFENIGNGGIGLITATSSDTVTARAIAGTSNYIDVSNGNGVSGNPTVTVDPNYLNVASVTTSSTGAISRLLKDTLADIFSVKDYGAKGDNATDDTAAIQAAIDAIPSTGISFGLYFPNGQFLINNTINIIGKNVHIFGDGPNCSRLIANYNGVILNFDGTGATTPTGGISRLAITTATVQSAQILIKAANESTFSLDNLYLFSIARLWDISSTTTVQINQITGLAHGTLSALKFSGVGGCVNNVTVNKDRSIGHTGPTIELLGVITSLQFCNSTFGGVGSSKVVGISSIARTNANFTVNTSGNHGFNTIGDILVIRSANASYNGAWAIASIPSSTQIVVTVANAFSAFSSAGATAEKLESCVYMNNVSGAINEGRFANCLFAGIDGIDYGTCAFYVDGTNSANDIAVWDIVNCLFDCGQTGIFLISTDAAPAILTFNFTGCHIRGTRNNIQMRNAKDIHFSNCSTEQTGATLSPTSDINTDAALYIDSSGSVMRGLSIDGCTFGRNPNWETAPLGNGANNQYGIHISNGANIQGFTVVGNFIYGLTAAELIDTAFNDASSFGIRIENNTFCTGTSGEQALGASIRDLASANSVALPFGDVFRLTGAVQINTLTGGWTGRKVTLLIKDGLTLAATNSAPVLAAGAVLTIVYYNGVWYP